MAAGANTSGLHIEYGQIDIPANLAYTDTLITTLI